MHNIVFCHYYYSLCWNMKNELKRNRDFMFNCTGKTWLNLNYEKRSSEIFWLVNYQNSLYHKVKGLKLDFVSYIEFSLEFKP